jgi:hypothetical protein
LYLAQQRGLVDVVAVDAVRQRAQLRQQRLVVQRRRARRHRLRAPHRAGPS